MDPKHQMTEEINALEQEQSNQDRNSIIFRMWKKMTEKKSQIKTPQKQLDKNSPDEPEADSLASSDVFGSDTQTPPEQLGTQFAQDADLSTQPESGSLAQETNGPDAAQPPLEPKDAQVYISVSSDWMVAQIEVEAPENGGADIEVQAIIAALHQEGVTTGIDEQLIAKIVENKWYGETYQVAHGTAPVNGEDGSVIEHFAREQDLKPQVREDGTMDYKNLNAVCTVEPGTAICTIVPPTQGVDGVNLKGAPLRSMPGRAAVVPQGTNTALSEDGTQLQATCAGCLRFQHNQFHVDEALRIRGNVDYSVGNIDFTGDVLVDGDVFEGFSIRAGKNVVVSGIVEGATIIAGGNIELRKGMNGMNRGVLEAKKDVRGKFFENCTVKAGGSIYAESIINSNVQSQDKVIAQGRRGLIAGGSCTAVSLVEAKTIGGASNIFTVIQLGTLMETLKQRAQLEFEIRTLETELSAWNKDIAYLERSAQTASLSPERQKQLNERKTKRAIHMMKLSTAKKKLDVIIDQIGKVNTCRLTCREMYPPTKIIIGNASLQIKDVDKNVFYYYLDGEIKRGSN